MIMGKDSEFYKEKKKNQLLRLREINSRLPGFAVDYLYSKELTTQTSTLISYGYDLLTFFSFLQEVNPVYKNKEIKDFSISDIANLTSQDIVEFQRFLELNLSKENPHENGKKAIARKMSPLRGLYKYHHTHKNIVENPTKSACI